MLRLMNVALSQARQAELKRDIHRGLEQLDRGESAPLDMETIKAKARLRYDNQSEHTS